MPENELSIMNSMRVFGTRHALVRLGTSYFDAAPNLKRDWAGSGAEHFMDENDVKEDEKKYGKLACFSLKGDALAISIGKMFLATAGMDKLLEFGVGLMPDK